MTEAIANITNIATSVLSFVESNAVTMAFMCSGLLGIGIGVVKKLVGRY